MNILSMAQLKRLNFIKKSTSKSFWKYPKNHNT